MLNYSNGTLKFSGGLLNPIPGVGPRPSYTVTTYSEHGTVIATPVTGHYGDLVTLSNTPDTDYEFDHYTIYGTSNVTGDVFSFENSDVGVTGYFNYAPPAPSIDGYIIQFKWNPEKNENITVQGLYADGVALTSSDIYQGKWSNNGTETALTSSEISDAVGGGLAKYGRMLEFWIDKPNATSLTWHTNQYYQPEGTCLVNIWSYVKDSWDYRQVLTDEPATMAVNTNYTYNI